MAWDRFRTPDEQGRSISSSKQLAVFRANFADRFVEATLENGRPLIMVLEKPYKLKWLQARDSYELLPMQLRDLPEWPPTLKLAAFGRFPRPGDGDVIEARVAPSEKAGGPSILIIRGEFKEQKGTCSLDGYPLILLESIARTLNRNVGESFQSLNDIELSSVD